MMIRKNTFGQVIPEIREILEDSTIRDYVKKTIVSVLNHLEVEKPESVVEHVIELARNYNAKEDYEAEAHRFLQEQGVTARIPEKLTGRADLIYSQVKDYLPKTGRILDLGCGDGKVGEKIRETGLEVTLTDVYEHSHVKETGLEFIKCSQGSVPSDEKYDAALVLTVFHHSEKPMTTLEEAKILTKKGGKIIVIESVYGIDDKTDFGRLSHEEQRLSNIFFDHFYNRVIHYSTDPSKKVPVPFNFRTPEEWKDIFEKQGMKQIAVERLGIDQPSVPEYHTLHVVEVR